MSLETELTDLLRGAEDFVALVADKIKALSAKVVSDATTVTATPPAVDLGPSSSDSLVPPAGVATSVVNVNPDGSPVASPETVVTPATGDTTGTVELDSPAEDATEGPEETAPTTNPDGSPVASPEVVTETVPGLSSPVPGTMVDGVFTPSILP